MKNSEINKMIIGALEGSLNAAQQRELDAWLQTPRNRQYFEAVRRTVGNIQRSIAGYTPDRDRLKAQLSQRVTAINKVAARRRMIRNILGSCAVVLIVAVASFFSAVAWSDGRARSMEEAAVMQFSAVGGKSQIVLSDGSKVWLNSGSNLTFTSSNEQRVVALNGEGYFEVAKDEQRPFSVQCDSGLDVVVTGTKFNVESMRDHPTVVSLLEGAVELNAVGVMRALAPQQSATYDPRSGELKIRDSEVGSHMCWIHNRLTFDNKPLSYICDYLSQWYDVRVVSDSSIESLYSFTFSLTDESIDQVLAMMADIHPLKYTSIGGGDILITKL